MRSHREHHKLHRVGWLRAAVLGANDGLISTASLMVGVASASGDRSQILVAGLAGLVAGAMSMAAGEYVSVSSQADSERSDIARETRELKEEPDMELTELQNIYISRGLDPATAREVARQLTAKDALQAHARDELGITDFSIARPVQAALTSAATFSAGALLPLATALLAPHKLSTAAIMAITVASLALLGAMGSRVGGERSMRVGVLRVTFWGASALAVTAAIGRLVGVAV